MELPAIAKHNGVRVQETRIAPDQVEIARPQLLDAIPGEIGD
jgi:hypothetical protein